jgi:hypothetical protein
MFLQQRDSRVWRWIGGALQLVGLGLNHIESAEAPLNRGSYAAFLMAAAERALPHAIVLIVVDPPDTDLQQQHLGELRDRLAARADPRLKIRQLTEIASPEDLLDGYSYGAAARGRVMRAILPELLALSAIRKP